MNRIQTTDAPPADRREWLLTAGRWALLGGLGLLAGGLSAGRRGAPKTRCLLAEACGTCDRRRTCELPQALATRQEQSD